MAEDADSRLFAVEPDPGLLRHLSFLVEDMNDSDLDAATLKDDLSGKPALFILINIAGHRDDRRNALQSLNDTAIPDVPGMQNLADSGKMLING